MQHKKNQRPRHSLSLACNKFSTGNSDAAYHPDSVVPRNCDDKLCRVTSVAIRELLELSMKIAPHPVTKEY